MFLKLLILFICIPVLEIAILLKLGNILGIWATLAVIMITAIVGASLARLEGLRVVNKIHTELQGGYLPTEELTDGILILVAGIVLLTPGFFTDTVGILVLIPWTRKYIKNYLKKKFDTYIASRRNNSFHFDLE